MSWKISAFISCRLLFDPARNTYLPKPYPYCNLDLTTPLSTCWKITTFPTGDVAFVPSCSSCSRLTGIKSEMCLWKQFKSYPHTDTLVLSQYETLTFRDLPVVSESSTQRDGDGGQVGHLVAVGVHSTVSSRADWLWGQTGAVEARVWDGPHCCTTVAAEQGSLLERLDSVLKLCTCGELWLHIPLREIKGCYFRLELSDVIQVNSIRAKMAASLICNRATKSLK